MRRLRDEFGFTLTEVLAAVVIIGILLAIVVPVYAIYLNPARAMAALSNVRSAVPAAEVWANNHGTYSGVSGANLRSTTAGIGATVKAVAVNANLGYCLQDIQSGSVENYVGGNPGSALQPGYNAATLQYGTCQQAVGAAAH